MKSRCENPNYSHYSYYGGRGIKVCESWRSSYENFVFDMGLRPLDMTLDRIDSEGDYSPDNCRWASREQQVDNRRNAVLYDYNGERVSLKQIAARHNTTRAKLYNYLYKGISLEDAINRVTDYQVGGALTWDDK